MTQCPKKHAETQRKAHGICSVINTGWIVSRMIETDHGGQGKKCRNQKEKTGFLPAKPVIKLLIQKEEERPDQIKLYLHPQKPKMGKGRGTGEPGKVGGILCNLPPVVISQKDT